MIQTQLELEGVRVLTGHKAVAVTGTTDGQELVVADSDGNEQQLGFDRLIVAVGRRANSTGFGRRDSSQSHPCAKAVRNDMHLAVRPLGDQTNQSRQRLSGDGCLAVGLPERATRLPAKTDTQSLVGASPAKPQMARPGNHPKT